jgi:hypothetical protein
VSRRRERGSGRRPSQSGGGQSDDPPERAAGQSGGAWAASAPAPNRRPPRLSFVAQVGVLVAVFAVVSLIADLAGAANLGVALGIGVIAFAIALVAVIVKN